MKTFRLKIKINDLYAKFIFIHELLNTTIIDLSIYWNFLNGIYSFID